MENINIENIVEETVKTIEETTPVPVQSNGVSKGEVAAIALVAYTVFETVKWAGGKLFGLIKKPKTKKNKVVEEVDIETPLPEIDEEETK